VHRDMLIQVPLGLLNVDENTTTGMLEIVNKFKRYLSCRANCICAIINNYCLLSTSDTLQK